MTVGVNESHTVEIVGLTSTTDLVQVCDGACDERTYEPLFWRPQWKASSQTREVAHSQSFLFPTVFLVATDKWPTRLDKKNAGYSNRTFLKPRNLGRLPRNEATRVRKLAQSVVLRNPTGAS